MAKKMSFAARWGSALPAVEEVTGHGPELTLMAVSSLVAVAGIAVSTQLKIGDLRLE